ncbi:MAG: P-loop NTPase [Myxococcota bacterium]
MSRSPRLIAVGGGKGGVGKSLVTANLAVALADEGHRVVAVDTDLPGANLHTCLGVRPPRASLAHFVAGRETDLAKLVVDTPVENLRLIGATGGHPGFARLRPSRRAELSEALRKLPCDYALLDVAAGTHPEVIDAFLVGDACILVCTPEPTSVENIYSFLRAALFRRVRASVLSEEVCERIDLALDPLNERGIRTPLDLQREIAALDAADAERFADAVARFRPALIVNQVRSVDDIKLGFQLASVCRKYFGLEAEYLGYVNHDDAVRQATLARCPVVKAFPDSDAAIYLRRIAGKLLGSRDERRRGARA